MIITAILTVVNWLKGNFKALMYSNGKCFFYVQPTEKKGCRDSQAS